MCLAVPGQILEIRGGSDLLLRSGRVSFGGIVKDVSLALVPEAEEGEYVLVHVGLALSVVDEREARRVFEMLKQMGGVEEIAGGEP